MYLNNNFSTKQFYNLNNYYKNNSKGSCGYVALSMILSFYDTYWDDRVIPENYDQNANFQTGTSFESPGIRIESTDFTNTAIEYYDKVQNDSNLYFHSYLIMIGKETFNYFNENNNANPCGSAHQGMKNLLRYSFLQDGNFKVL